MPSENFNFMLVIVFNAARMISIEALNIQIHIRDIPKRTGKNRQPNTINAIKTTLCSTDMMDLNSNGKMVAIAKCKVVCVPSDKNGYNHDQIIFKRSAKSLLFDKLQQTEKGAKNSGNDNALTCNVNAKIMAVSLHISKCQW